MFCREKEMISKIISFSLFLLINSFPNQKKGFICSTLFMSLVDTAKTHAILLSRCRKSKVNLTQKIFVPMHIRIMEMF